jgi:glutathione synthase/RimK-type ligase-like ATP-grasp enzyme
MSVSDSGFRLAIATCAQFPQVYPDDVYFVSQLEQLGVKPVVCIWNDPSVDWRAFDAVLIRTVWDYFQHYATFLAWLDTLDELGVPTINDTRLIRWNSEKRYLLDIEQQGVPIIPTRVAPAGRLAETLASVPEDELVIKPSVSGGAWHTVRGTPGTAAFSSAIEALPNDLDFLIQPFVPEIATNGEWSLLYFAGIYSHAVIKRPASGDYRVQLEHGGTAIQAAPDAAIVQAADSALAAVAALGHREQAYARVDGVVIGDQFRIMELELVEPLLHLTLRPEAAERFAAHVAARLRVISRTNETAHR